MLKIHADPITINSRKVIAGLQFIGAEYELVAMNFFAGEHTSCLLYTSPSPRDATLSRMPSSA